METSKTPDDFDFLRTSASDSSPSQKYERVTYFNEVVFVSCETDYVRVLDPATLYDNSLGVDYYTLYD